jgi:hypothetical protein
MRRFGGLWRFSRGVWRSVIEFDLASVMTDLIWFDLEVVIKSNQGYLISNQNQIKSNQGNQSNTLITVKSADLPI